VIEASVREHFGDSDHNLGRFKVAMEKDKGRPEITVLIWGKTDFN